MRTHTVCMTKPKRPRDPNQLAHLIAAIATGEVEDAKTDDGKNPAAVPVCRLAAMLWAKFNWRSQHHRYVVDIERFYCAGFEKSYWSSITAFG